MEGSSSSSAAGVGFARELDKNGQPVILIFIRTIENKQHTSVIPVSEVAHWQFYRTDEHVTFMIRLKSTPLEPFAVVFRDMNDEHMQNMKQFLQTTIFLTEPMEQGQNYLCLENNGKLFTIYVQGKKVQLAVQAITFWSVFKPTILNPKECRIIVGYPGKDVMIGVDEDFETLVGQMTALLGKEKYKPSF
jgi:hypothetical protein